MWFFVLCMQLLIDLFLFLQVKFTITEDKESDCIFIECDGLGLTPKDRK